MHSFRPILLLGPGRGGTTLLYKLLSLHRDAAFISNFRRARVGAPFCLAGARIVAFESGVAPMGLVLTGRTGVPPQQNAAQTFRAGPCGG